LRDKLQIRVTGHCRAHTLGKRTACPDRWGVS
jgi:hypothetical protein